MPAVIEDIEELYTALHKAAASGIWSQGISLSRSAKIVIDRASSEEIVLRIVTMEKAVHPQVTLWPADEDWFCNCDGKQDPCSHIVAATAALKNGIASPNLETGLRKIHYTFTVKDNALTISRSLSPNEQLSTSLTSYVAGIQSGRIASAPVAATQDDFKIDTILSTLPTLVSIPPSNVIQNILRFLDKTEVIVDGQKVFVSASLLKPKLELVDHFNGFCVRPACNDSGTRIFSNGAAIQNGALHPFENKIDQRYLSESGIEFGSHQFTELVTLVIPKLKTASSLEIKSTRLPNVQKLQPSYLLQIEKLSNESISVTARIVYGSPPIAEVDHDGIHLFDPKIVIERDLIEERRLLFKLSTELNLHPRTPINFNGEDAILFTKRCESLGIEHDNLHSFVPIQLSPVISFSDSTIDISFNAADNKESGLLFSDIYSQWQSGKSSILMADGRWAKLPHDWLDRFGERAQQLLDAKSTDGHLPLQILLEASELLEGTTSQEPEFLGRLRRMLLSSKECAPAVTPADLTVQLRSYQQEGLNWLALLRESELGGILADDMGLGKTLQALCALSGKTLVIAPTSVLYSWKEQIQAFRPTLRVNVFHGTERMLSKECDITLTTYGVLRLDIDTITKHEWETIILDESQTIKNADSQIAKAAHRLKAPFRLALSGTPVENRLSDLFSQFKFLNPGLILDSEENLDDVRRKVKPFILRRLKKDVAIELPPKTEMNLYCDLSEEESDLYSSVLAASRQEVLKQLESGTNVFHALELLLRLRQACCHPSLVPGSGIDRNFQSSKLNLLFENLDRSVESGHKALIFSQWTSFLDLIQERLARAGVAFTRLDGSTRDRDSIIETFQSQAGPPVMMISLKAGGLGLTLTEADHVYIVDPWWNPAVEEQAAARAHRIGQEKPVMVYKLCTKNTIEEKVLDLQKYKQDLAQSVLGAKEIMSLLQ